MKFLYLTCLLSLVLAQGACIRFSNEPPKKKKKPSLPAPPTPPNAEGTFQVKFETSKGDFTIEVHRDWAPFGAEQFYTLVNEGYYDGCKFFRVVPNFMTQWGLNGDPAVTKKWNKSSIPDDPVKRQNKYGTVSFATAGPGTRTTQIFINMNDHNSHLDRDGFAPFGMLIHGRNTVENIETKYKELPKQGKIMKDGNRYLDRYFSDLDYIIKATVISESKPKKETADSSKKDSQKEKSVKKNPTEKPEEKPSPEKAKTP